MSLQHLQTIKEERHSQENMDLAQNLLDKAKDREHEADENEQFIPDEQKEMSDEEVQDQQQKQDNVKSFVVGSGMGGFLFEETFGFDDKKQKNNKQIKRLTLNTRLTQIVGLNKLADDEEDDHQLYEKIPQYLAWGIIFYASFNNAMMPPWIMTIPAEKYLRIAWRFLLQGIFLIPFIMYEYRTGNEKVKSAYTMEFLLRWTHMRKVYMASLTTTVTFAVFLFCFDYTNISSVFVLGSQTNFWLSVFRKKENNHNIEGGGKIMCVAGYLLICLDSYMLNTDTIPESAKNYINPLLYNRPIWMRIIIGNTIPFLASIILAELSKANQDLRSVFPPFLANFCVAFFVCLNMCMVSFFMDGTSINFDSRWGWFGLFQNGKFMGFFYMSTMLSIGVFISSILISKLFEPIVPATAALFEPVITAILCDIATVQYYPSAIACFGYVFLLPGQFIIIVGQHILKKQQEQEQKQKLEQQQQIHASRAQQ
ncbi:unnamed protein product [Paramecium pentaurelia]|uniref:Uncharacterized protein n=1 Tax=Paramecium pentaurelia TaxID=43138 RepID=A0A8S1XLQ5_9CILI|nr:unnamed protein product [Paramecium pentaurelia]